MRHLMPIVTPRLLLRPPTLDDLDAIQAAKEDAWDDSQLWMAWAFDNQRPRQALERSIRRVMNFQSQSGIALAGFHKFNGDFVVRTPLDLTDEAGVYETGYWVSPKYARQGMATEATTLAAASWRNWDSGSFASPPKRPHGASTAPSLTVMNSS